MFYKIVRFIFAWIFRIVYRIHTSGVENIPSEGACIIAPNHISAIDPIILGVIERRQIRFLAKAELFRIPILRGIIKALGAFPVNRDAGDITAIKHTLEVLDGGELLCVFPQGTRCPSTPVRETLPKLKSGVGFMTLRAHAPVVPVYFKTKSNKLRLFGRTDVIFGKMIPADEFAKFNGRTKYADASTLIFDRICELEESARAGA